MKQKNDDEDVKAGRTVGRTAQDDPLINPDGVYSGPSKRVAITDGTFAPVKGIPKWDKSGRV